VKKPKTSQVRKILRKSFKIRTKTLKSFSATLTNWLTNRKTKYPGNVLGLRLVKVT